MRFWDSSAVIPLLVEEATSARVRAIHAEDIGMATWWTTGVECVSALTRLEREERLGAGALGDALARLDGLAAGWIEVQPIQRVRQSALRLLRVHPLRAADALQLAAAIAAAEDHPATMPFVTLDERLGLAAEREGFRVVLPPMTASRGPFSRPPAVAIGSAGVGRSRVTVRHSSS